MKISILVPVFGVEKYIARCAISLFNQTYKDIEYIFVDDCTQDNSIKILNDILKDFPDRKNQVKIIKHNKNLGLAGARNTALDNATGDYIWHIDSDDEILPDSVEIVSKLLSKKGADIVIFDIEHKFKTGKSFIEKSNISPHEFGHSGAILERKTPVYLVAHIVKREIAIKEDARPITGINYGEDFLVTPRISYYAKRIEYIPRALYIYRHANEMSYTNHMTLNNIINLERAFEILRDFFNKNLNAQESSELIRRGEIMNKLTMSLVCSYNDFNYVCNLYPYIKSRNLKFLKPHHRVLWFFLCKNYLTPIKVYRYIRSKFR